MTLTPHQTQAVLANVELLRRQLGESWLDDELAAITQARRADTTGGRRPTPRFHRLAELFDQVRPILDLPPDRVEVTAALGELNRLSISLQVLSNASVAGLKARLGRLKHDDLFASTSFEINVAADFARQGHVVEFIPETTERTAEFIVDGTVEVECKKKVEPSARDRRNDELWDLLSRRLQQRFAASGRGLRVDLTTADDPTREDVEWTVAQVAHFVDSGTPTETITDHRRILYLARLAMTGGAAMEATAPAGSPLRTTSGKVELTAVFDEATGTLRPHTAYDFSYRTTREAEWVAGIRSSLKKAAGQFSYTKPAIAVVGIPAPSRWTDRVVPEDIKVLTRDFLRQNTSVSAVLLVTDELVQTNDGLRPLWTTVHQVNDDARHPLPEGLLG